MQVEIKRIQQSLGITTIFVTHDQREAMALADRVVVLNAGRIEQAGTPDDLYARPQTRFVADFIGDNNLLDVEVSAGQARFAGSALGVAEGTPEGKQTLCIRPEAITLSEPGSESNLTGTVVSTRRLGAVIEREIDVAGQSFQQSSFAGQTDAAGHGARVALSWAPDAAWVLPQ